MLKSAGVRDALQTGKVSFAEIPHPAEDQIKLAGEVLPPLVTATGAQIVNYKVRYEQSAKQLEKLRDDYNKTWKSAAAQLAAAQKAAEMWPALEKAVKALVLDTKP